MFLYLAQGLGLTALACGRPPASGDDSGTTPGESAAVSTAAEDGVDSLSTTRGSSATEEGDEVGVTTDPGSESSPSTSTGSSGSQQTQCFPAFFIPEGTPEPPGGWPLPDGYGGDGTPNPGELFIDPICTMAVGDGDGDSAGDGDTDGGIETGSEAGTETGTETGGIEGEFTCNCLILEYGGWQTVLDVSTELVGEECCFTWELSGGGGLEGRPFLVDGQAATAARRLRSDWSGRDAKTSLSEHASSLSADARSILGAHWVAAAAMEHASVAAFARHVLQLMALGAPEPLIASAQAAIIDEHRHARDCFGIASTYLDRPVGPDSFPEAGRPFDVDLESVLREVIAEGCIGETIAALRAQHASARCEQTYLSDRLARIADDELRHAMLAWEFVRWALDQDPKMAQGVLRQALGLLESGIGPVVEGPECGYPQHGCLARRDRERMAEEGRTEVIVPLIRGLLAEPAPRLH
jgi:hypothetical protein